MFLMVISSVYSERGRNILRIALSVFFILSLFIEVSTQLGRLFFFGWKLSPSISGHLFLVIRGAPWQRGDLVAFVAPKTRYGEGVSWWMKYAMGIPGDKIVVRGNKIWVHGYYCGVMQDKAYDGKELSWQKSMLIPPGFVFVWGTHRRSFDSRYQQVGLINETSILGRGTLVF